MSTRYGRRRSLIAYVDEDLAEQIEQLAADCNGTISATMGALMRRGLHSQPPLTDEQRDGPALGGGE